MRTAEQYLIDRIGQCQPGPGTGWGPVCATHGTREAANGMCDHFIDLLDLIEQRDEDHAAALAAPVEGGNDGDA